MGQNTKTEKKELVVLVNFVRIYCEAKHGAGLEKKDVINTGTLSELKAWKQSRKRPD